MKRIGCLIAALSLLMTLSACHTGGEAEPTLRIGVALYQQEDTFIETVTRELQRVALEKEQAQNCKINLYILPKVVLFHTNHMTAVSTMANST